MHTTHPRNVVVIRFDDSAKTYRALSRLKRADAEELVDVHAAAVIERKADGSLNVADGDDHKVGSGAIDGSLIGVLVGLLGGPLGILLGWGAGALIGGALDAHKASDASTAIGTLTRTVPPGQSALIADVTETREGAIEDDVAADGGTVVRRPTHEVLDEVEATADASKAAQSAAASKLHAEKRPTHHEEFHERWERIKDKLHV
ncbi:DUF1269 domain-containing protein [Streptomyces sp. NPDC048441]|uniref:DUF1269 domain-containing protein n=1 Tax=Streptomyces sp. NPDC048441 TaxID=3365552 RepID=UPI00371B4D2F